MSIIAIFILTRFALATPPSWLSPLATCANSIGREDTSIMQLTSSMYSHQHVPQIEKYFGKDAVAFVGFHGDKAGLWIVNSSKSYFVDMKDLKQDADPLISSRKLWNMRVMTESNPPLNLSFGYFESSTQNKRYFSLERVSVGNDNTSPLATSPRTQSVQALTTSSEELKDQLKDQLALALENLKRRYIPSVSVNDDPALKRKAEALKKRLDALNLMFGDRDTQNLERGRALYESKLISQLELCESVLKKANEAPSKEFGSLLVWVQLVKKHLKHSQDPNDPDNQANPAIGI